MGKLFPGILKEKESSEQSEDYDFQANWNWCAAVIFYLWGNLHGKLYYKRVVKSKQTNQIR